MEHDPRNPHELPQTRLDECIGQKGHTSLAALSQTVKTKVHARRNGCSKLVP
jgi:hypothetical protein